MTDDPAVIVFSSGTTGRPKAVTAARRGLCGSEQVNGFAEGLVTVATVAMGGVVLRAVVRQRRPSGLRAAGARQVRHEQPDAHRRRRCTGQPRGAAGDPRVRSDEARGGTLP